MTTTAFDAIQMRLDPPHPLTRELREGAFPVVPEAVQDLVDADQQITDALARAATTALEGYAGWLDRQVQNLTSGGDLPDDLAEQAADVLAGLDRRRVGELALANLRSRLHDGARAIFRAHLDEMLTGLAAELPDILAGVRAAAAVVDGVDLLDPSAVADASADQLAALAELKALRPRYRSLRDRQLRILAAAYEDPPASWGIGVWAGVARTGVTEFSNVAQYGLSDADLPQMLWFRRLLNRDDVWLPTMTELKDAMANGAGFAIEVTRPMQPAGEWQQ